MELILPREKQAMETKNHLYSATKEILHEYGFKYVTVRNICDRANCTYGAFYYHFKSKEALLSEYGRDVFRKKLAENPPPETLDRDDFVKMIAWYYNVYAMFCEEMGWEVVKYVYDNCETDVFYDVCFTEHVEETLKIALQNGYLRMAPERFDWLVEDIKYLYKGIVREWSSYGVTHNEVTLADILWRILYRFISGFTSDKYHQKFPHVQQLENSQITSTNKVERKPSVEG